MAKSVLLLGSYGQTNLGDDLLMFNYLTRLRDLGFDDIWVNTNNEEYIPTLVMKQFPNLKIIRTYQVSLASWVGILRKVDVVVYGGGTVYKELYGSTGRGRYSVIGRVAVFNILARLLGTPVCHWHIGIGMLRTWRGRTLTKLALRASNYTIFRDRESYGLAVQQLHLKPGKICLGTDGLFLSDIWQKPLKTKELRIPRGRNTNVIGINVLSDIPDWIDRQGYVSELQAFIKGLLEQDTFVIFLPFQNKFNPRSDLAFMQNDILPALKKFQNYYVADDMQIDTVQGYFSQIDILVGMRFHSLLLATAVGKPFLAITYDTKCARFVQESHYPHAVALEGMTAGKLSKAFQTLVRKKPSARKRLLVVAKDNYQRTKVCKTDLVF